MQAFRNCSFLLTIAVASLAGLALFVRAPAAKAQDATPTPQPHGNANCLMCHADPDFTGNLPDGETVSLHVDPGTYYRSVHADAGLECLACHANQKDYPHRSSQLTCLECHAELGGDPQTTYQPLSVMLAYADSRAITIEANESCRACHAEKFEEAVDSAHARVLAGGNREAPLCVDCHGSHDITPPDEPRARISQTCAKCHQAVYTTYRTSIHGMALETESNPDVPTCVDCHGVHSVRGPRDPAFRNDTIAICGGCHGDKARMDKYGISTEVFETYLDDFHGRTVNFFRRETTNIASNKATCFDCHGIHNIRSPEDPLSTVYPTNLQRTCQQCHADATIAFPQAWLSHYSPTWERTPVLFIVNTFYQIMIPTLILGFVGYIGLDARRRIVHHHQSHNTSTDEEEYDDDTEESGD